MEDEAVSIPMLLILAAIIFTVWFIKKLIDDINGK